MDFDKTDWWFQPFFCVISSKVNSSIMLNLKWRYNFRFYNFILFRRKNNYKSKSPVVDWESFIFSYIDQVVSFRLVINIMKNKAVWLVESRFINKLSTPMEPCIPWPRLQSPSKKGKDTNKMGGVAMETTSLLNWMTLIYFVPSIIFCVATSLKPVFVTCVIYIHISQSLSTRPVYMSIFL